MCEVEKLLLAIESLFSQIEWAIVSLNFDKTKKAIALEWKAEAHTV